jgi:DNA-binding CsgD family transcriptional regulator/Flp pilus assembly protein TadD
MRICDRTVSPDGLDCTPASAGETLALAEIALWLEHFEEAERLFTSLLDTPELPTNLFGVFQAAFSWTDGLCRLGRLEEALALSERVFEVAKSAPVALPFAVAARAQVLLEQGRLEDARVVCRQLAALAARHRQCRVVGHDLHLRGTLAWRNGDVEEACATFRTLQELIDEWGLHDASTFRWAADAMSAYLDCGETADAERVVERIDAATTLPSLWPRVVALAGRAALAELGGRLDEAQDLYAEAVALQSAMRLPLARAEALTQFGAFLVRRGNRSGARSVLAEALRLAERHGAEWHAARARAELRRAAGRPRRGGRGALTPQETTVATFARAGHTNRQIAQQLCLSENTVETHLARVYRKLAIRRRWELIARPHLL